LLLPVSVMKIEVRKTHHRVLSGYRDRIRYLFWGECRECSFSDVRCQNIGLVLALIYVWLWTCCLVGGRSGIQIILVILSWEYLRVNRAIS
jgi:hypothetical protein